AEQQRERDDDGECQHHDLPVRELHVSILSYCRTLGKFQWFQMRIMRNAKQASAPCRLGNREQAESGSVEPNDE
ncbi:MAG: hypothetical protein M3Y72_14440, partial [Acidobacteriota bacterium]|nr:hypothetical protein [Acidobacteriota bacterium]